MATLQEVAQWVEGIYQLETTDPVMGGADGIDNRQAKELANRTLFLKNKLQNLINNPVALSSAINSSATDVAANSLAVKKAYDKAFAAQQSVDNIDVSAMPFLGGDQSYQNVTSARAMNVVYTNSTKPIFVVVTFKNDINSSDISFAVKINSVSIIDSYINTAGNSPDVFATFVVPAGATYEITNSSRVLNPTSIKNIWEMS